MNKMKVVFLVGFLLVLGACSKGPKKEFIEAYQEIIEEAQYAGAFDISVLECEIKEETENKVDLNLSDMLNSASVKGNYYFDKENNYQLGMTFDVFDEAIPLEIFGNKETVYLSASFLEGTVRCIENMGIEPTIDDSNLKLLDKKYIKLPAVMVTGLVNTEDSELLKPSDLSVKLLEKAKKNSFKKEGDIITHTFNAVDLNKLELNRYLDNALPIKFPLSSLTVRINLKTKEIEWAIKMRNIKEDMKLTLVVKIASEKKKSIVNTPKNSEVLSILEVEEIMSPFENNTRVIIEKTPKILEE